jgi:Flp pilus assembly protein TadG
MIRFKSKSDSNRSQRGATMAEFAVISAVFFMIVFAIIEFGRLLYTHNALPMRRDAALAMPLYISRLIWHA